MQNIQSRPLSSIEAPPLQTQIESLHLERAKERKKRVKKKNYDESKFKIIIKWKYF